MFRHRPLLVAAPLLLALAAPLSAAVLSQWSGENNANDSVGSNDGTVQGTVGYRAGWIGQGFDFSGAGWVQVASPTGLGSTASGFSIFLYEDQDTFVGGEGVVSLTRSQNDSGFILQADPSNSGSFVFKVNTSGNAGGYTTLTAPSFNLGEGHFLIATFDAATHTMRIYHETTLEAEKTGVAGGDMLLKGGEQVDIGLNPSSSTEWDGLMDEVRIYDHALSASEIAGIFGGGGGGGGTLIFGDDFESGNTNAWSSTAP